VGAWGSGNEDVKRVPPLSIVPYRLRLANQMLAILPSDPSLQSYVSQFIADMEDLYPEFNGTAAGSDGNGNLLLPSLASVYIPPLASRIIQFSSTTDLTDYISDPNYGLDDSPRIWAAIVFNKGPPGWDVSIRFNYTEVPNTLLPPVNTLQRGYVSNNVQQYTFAKSQQGGGPFNRAKNVDPVLTQNQPGFLTLQLMVDRYVQPFTAPPFYAASQSIPIICFDAGGSLIRLLLSVPWLLTLHCLTLVTWLDLPSHLDRGHTPSPVSFKH
jgi:hypothetical protein